MLTCFLKIHNPILSQQTRRAECKGTQQQFNSKTLNKAKVNTKQDKKASYDRELHHISQKKKIRHREKILLSSGLFCPPHQSRNTDSRPGILDISPGQFLGQSVHEMLLKGAQSKFHLPPPICKTDMTPWQEVTEEPHPLRNVTTAPLTDSPKRTHIQLAISALKTGREKQRPHHHRRRRRRRQQQQQNI